MSRNTFKWSFQRFIINFYWYSLYCFQWNKHTNINYWKYHAKPICYPYCIIAIVTSASKRVHLGVRNLMRKRAICRILYGADFTISQQITYTQVDPFAWRGHNYIVVSSWVLNNKVIISDIVIEAMIFHSLFSAKSHQQLFLKT